MKFPGYNDTPAKRPGNGSSAKSSTTKKSTTPINKSGWNKSVKVSQSTLDDIKKMGMAKALKLAGQNSKATQSGLVKEYQEATRRLYGEKRFAAATGQTSTASTAPKYKSPDAARAANAPAKYKSPDAARAASTPAKPAAKKSSGIGGTLKKIATDTVKGTVRDVIKFGAGPAAAGAGLAGRAAIKVGAAAAKQGALSTSGRLAAKAGKAVSQSQYDAMMVGASKASKVAAAKTAAKTASKTVTKKAVAAKTAVKTTAANTSAKLKTADEARMAALRTPPKKAPAKKTPAKKK